MTIQVISSTSSSGNSSAPSVAMPADWQAGDLLVVAMSKNADRIATDNNGANPMAKDIEVVGLSGGNGFSIHSRILTASERSTWDFTFAAGGERWTLVAFVVRNWSKRPQIYDSITAVAAGGSVCPAATITENGCLAVAVANQDGSGDTFNTPLASGWTDIKIVNAQQAIAVAYKVVNKGSTGTVSMNITGSVSGHAALTVFAIKPLLISPFPSSLQNA